MLIGEKFDYAAGVITFGTPKTTLSLKNKLSVHHTGCLKLMDSFNTLNKLFQRQFEN